MTGACLWLCGLPGSGRSTIAAQVARDLGHRGVAVELLDTAEARDELVLGHFHSDAVSDSDLARLAFVARLLARQGVIAVVAADSGKDALRQDLSAKFDHFVVVHVDTPAELCAARGGAGSDAARFEAPLAPDLRVITHDRSPAASAAQVVSYLEAAGLIPTGFVS
ncbi:MAG: adenylyl-sulfate kinase [Acidimicrobiia bacterium]